MSFPSSDSFSRTVASGWGTATVGGNWTASGSASNSVNGSEAVVVAGANQSNDFSLAGTNLYTEITGVFWIDKIPVGGTAVPRFRIRNVAGVDYHLRATLQASGVMQVRLANADVGFLGGSLNLTYTAGRKVRFRARAVGNTPTTVSGKAWFDGDAEPTSWQITANDSAVAVQTAGTVGVRFAVQSTTTNGPVTFYLDDWTAADVYTPPAPTLNHAGVYSFSETIIGVGTSTDNITTVRIEATPVGGGTTIVGPAVTPSVSRWAYPRVTGLAPATEYNIAVIDNGANTTLDTLQSRTLSPLRRNFIALSASCQKSGSNHTGWASLKAENADFFAHQGDLHYADASVEATWRDAMNNALGASNMRDFLRDTPMTYHYDNHDWGGNTSWRESPCSTYIPTAMRELMGDQIDTVGMYSTWASGGIRFIETDQWGLRDEAVTAPTSDFAVGKTMLGLTQRQWLFDTFLASKEPLIVWFCSFPLYGNNLGNGRWGNFRDEAAIINTWLNAHPDIKKRIVCVGGDSHNICADDGTNTLWNLPSLNASPIDRSGDTGGSVSGTWNIVNTTPDLTYMYYSRMSFVWNADTVNFTWQGKRSDGTIVATWSKQFKTVAPSLVIGGVETPTAWSVVQGGVEVPITSWSRVEGGIEVPLKNL